MADSLPPPAPSAPPTAGPPPGPTPDRRRAAVPFVVLGGALAVVAAAVIIVVVRGGSEDAGDNAAGEWNAIAAVDQRSGAVTIYDRDGEVVDELESGVEAPRVLQLSPNHLALTGEGESIAVVDVAAGEVTDAATGLGQAVDVLHGPDGGVLVVGLPEFGELQLVDTSGTVIDVGELADWDEPLINPFNVSISPDGRRLAATNIKVGSEHGGESAVVSFDPDIEPLVVDGNVVDVSDDGVTAIVRGRDGFDIVRYDLGGDELGRVELDTPPMGIVPHDDGTVLVVGEDGELTRMNPETGDVERTGSIPDLDEETRGLHWSRSWSSPHPAVLASELGDQLRLRVLQADGTAGEPIDFGGGIRRVEFGPDAGCAVVVTDHESTLIDLRAGTAVATLEEVAASGVVAAGACVAAMIGGPDGDAVLSATDGTIELDEGLAIAALSPDGTRVLVRDRDQIALRDVATLDDEPDDDVVTLSGEIAPFFVHR